MSGASRSKMVFRLGSQIRKQMGRFAIPPQPERMDITKAAELYAWGHGPLSRMAAGFQEPTASSRSARMNYMDGATNRAKVHNSLSMNHSTTADRPRPVTSDKGMESQSMSQRNIEIPKINTPPYQKMAEEKRITQRLLSLFMNDPFC